MEKRKKYTEKKTNGFVLNHFVTFSFIVCQLFKDNHKNGRSALNKTRSYMSGLMKMLTTYLTIT